MFNRLIELDGVADELIQRQVLRGIRRALMSIMVEEAAEYRITLARVADGIRSGQISPRFRSQVNEFFRTAGIPSSQVIDLGMQVLEGGREDWEIEDLNVVTSAYARHGIPTLDQIGELSTMTKRVYATTKRRERQSATMDVLIRKCQGIPEDEQS